MAVYLKLIFTFLYYCHHRLKIEMSDQQKQLDFLRLGLCIPDHNNII